tara:strand:+ start:4617 stop:4883 length:267 start_codon:yes stop_codon:yes gene_type:complete
MKQQINYDQDTLFVVGHCDTTINDQRIILDTFIKHDTLIIEKTIFDKEIQIIERLMERPDFGKSFCSILILCFVVFSIWKKWSCKKED